jgi:hypothetical protein
MSTFFIGGPPVPASTFSNPVKPKNCPPELEQLIAIKEALQVRINMAGTFATLGGDRQCAEMVRNTQLYIIELGQMFERKLKDPP